MEDTGAGGEGPRAWRDPGLDLEDPEVEFGGYRSWSSWTQGLDLDLDDPGIWRTQELELWDTGIGFGFGGHRDFPAPTSQQNTLVCPGRLLKELPSTLQSKECVLAKKPPREVPPLAFLAGKSKQIFSFIT